MPAQAKVENDLLTSAKDMEVHCTIDKQLNILIFALNSPQTCANLGGRICFFLKNLPYIIGP